MTFKELAMFILSQSEEVQESEATFSNLDECDSCSINRDNVKAVAVIESAFAPSIFGAPMGFYAIATSDEPINDKYDYHHF